MNELMLLHLVLLLQDMLDRNNPFSFASQVAAAVVLLLLLLLLLFIELLLLME